ncbi:MAG: hypothetical protein H6779_02060 [Candidatus Nomurabacteria bacterium]|nr:MAG: hypothetical protein H6779_02060 [Candidatus Nomurabacteria bacterium]
MKGVIEVAIDDVLNGLGLDSADFVVEHPADMTHGDYACNVAMVVAKQVGKAPRGIWGPISPRRSKVKSSTSTESRSLVLVF